MKFSDKFSLILSFILMVPGFPFNAMLIFLCAKYCGFSLTCYTDYKYFLGVLGMIYQNRTEYLSVKITKNNCYPAHMHRQIEIFYEIGRAHV